MGKRAPVVPRALSPECGYALALEDLVEPFLGRSGVIAIHGPTGYGKSTALRHLAACFAGRLDVHDSEREPSAEERLVVCARSTAPTFPVLASFRLAPWGRDEALEYLMACHAERCRSVMARLMDDPAGFPETCAELWSAVLDEMAGTEGIGPRHALARVAARAEGTRLEKHRVIRDVREGQRIVSLLLGGATARWPEVFGGAVVAEAVRLLSSHRSARKKLRAVWRSGAGQPLAATLLLALDPTWRPNGAKTRCLDHARLSGAQWRDVRLQGVPLRHAKLTGADLESARLQGADFDHANLRRARLDGADLTGARLVRASLERASLAHAHVARARLVRADLTGCDCTGALLREAVLSGANLTNARFVRADLYGVRLRGAELAGADFSRAHLTGAILESLDLRGASWSGTNFTGAVLLSCRLEGLSLPGALFEGADLCDANLTATDMPGATFRNADLRGARLGEISWEGADLRGADLRYANFHMGSSRSGLVDSVIPCEGSRTGFYTDDCNEQDFKAPEEIRKANLCKADLRGANIERVDFYLVDLRGAKYDAEQEEHLRRCGAILAAKKR